MNTAPLVTVGMPAYNAERFISLAIKSVLAQTFTDFELIITDDGSSDKTVEIARSFNDTRIKIISDGKNYGISHRLNQQIDLARGKYFCRMDADDIMMPDRIEKQIVYLESNPNVSVVSGHSIVIDDDNQILGIRSGIDDIHRFTMKDWISGRSLIHPTVTGKRDYFRQYYYQNEFKGVEDIDLWARSCEEKVLLILPVPFIFYRDPQKFKIKTYNFRQRQSKKLLKDLVNKGLLDKSVCKKSIRKRKIKSIIATLFSYLHIDDFMIARRNKPLIDKDHYNEILKAIEMSDHD